jgi:hypothetical protein
MKTPLKYVAYDGLVPIRIGVDPGFTRWDFTVWQPREEIPVRMMKLHGAEPATHSQTNCTICNVIRSIRYFSYELDRFADDGGPA